ncbi:hypothetical protein LTR33_005616 [Friedmanniomyces endolithicus]|nr:hypothetical protein LTR33_005616 [Friedmanniomyces endolithicus]
MTPWVLHDANYSFSLGTYYLDSAGNPTTIPVLARIQTRSEFKTALPNDMQADPYSIDFTEMTVQAESWKANLLPFHHPVEMYPELSARSKAIALEKDGVHEAVKSKKEYRTSPIYLDEAAESIRRGRRGF